MIEMQAPSHLLSLQQIHTQRQQDTKLLAAEYERQCISIQLREQAAQEEVTVLQEDRREQLHLLLESRETALQTDLETQRLRAMLKMQQPRIKEELQCMGALKEECIALKEQEQAWTAELQAEMERNREMQRILERRRAEVVIYSTDSLRRSAFKLRQTSSLNVEVAHKIGMLIEREAAVREEIERSKGRNREMQFRCAEMEEEAARRRNLQEFVKLQLKTEIQKARDTSLAIGDMTKRIAQKQNLLQKIERDCVNIQRSISRAMLEKKAGIQRGTRN